MENISSGQIEVYKDQVRQFSKNIVQLEKNLAEEQNKRLKLQTELDTNDKSRKNSPPPTKPKEHIHISPPPTETVIPVIPVLTAPIADLRFVSSRSIISSITSPLI